MKYFDSNSESHKIVFISRESVEQADVILYDKYNNQTTTINNIDVYCNNGYLTLTFDFEFTKDLSYLLSIKNESKLLFQDLCKAI
jgi:hypothetical protein